MFDNVKWYFISSLITKMFGVVNVAIISRHYTIEEIGALGMIDVFVNLLPILTTLHLDISLSKFLHDKKFERNVVLASSIVFLVIWGSCITILISFFSSGILKFLGVDSLSTTGTFFAMASSLIIQAFFFIEIYLQQLLKAKFLFVIKLFLSILNISMLYMHVSRLGGLESKYVALFTSHVFISLILVFKLNIFHKVNILNLYKVLIDMVKYSAPLTAQWVGAAISLYSDRLMIDYFSTKEEVGHYSLALSLGIGVYFILDSVYKAYFPRMMTEDIESGENRNIFLKTVFVGIILLQAAYTFFGEFVLEVILGREVEYIYYLIHLLIYMYVASVGYRSLMPIILRNNKKKILIYSAWGGAIVNILLNFLLIPNYGAFGAAFASVVSNVCYFFICYMGVYKLVKTTAVFKKLLFSLQLYVILGAIAVWRLYDI